MTPQIILASASQTRKLLMDSFGFPYQVIPADIDEKSIRDLNLKLRAKNIATAKAEAVVQNHQGIIIAADTFCVCNGVVLEKPKNLSEAKEMLAMQSNHTNLCYTGFCYIDTIKKIYFSTTAVTKYTFRDLSAEEIDIFVENNPVMQWSAAFSPGYTYQQSFINKISGSFSGFLHGLPFEYLSSCFQESGIELFK